MQFITSSQNSVLHKTNQCNNTNTRNLINEKLFKTKGDLLVIRLKRIRITPLWQR